MNKIEVTPKRASELMALGYQIECYLILPEPHVPAAPKGTNGSGTPRKIYKKTDEFTISVEHSGPTKGQMAKAWATAYKVLWAKDITRVYTKEHIMNTLKVAGNTDPSMFAYLTTKLGVLRQVHPK